MRIEILDKVPVEYVTAKPLRTYETQFVYTGFRRYDMERKTLMEFVETSKGILLKDVPMEMDVFSRGYSVETVTVSIYSESPRIWKETLNPFTTHFFREIQDQ